MIAREPWPTAPTARVLCLSPSAWDWTKSSWEPVGHPGRRDGAPLWTPAESQAVRRLSLLSLLAGICNIPCIFVPLGLEVRTDLSR